MILAATAAIAGSYLKAALGFADSVSQRRIDSHMDREDQSRP